MSNTVQPIKSDEMLKSLAAQLASQSVAIFLQQKQEREHEELIHFETLDELRNELEDQRQAISEKDKALAETSRVLTSLKFKAEATTLERDRFKTYWQEQLDINRNLKRELEELRANQPVGTATEAAEEKGATA
ncbi:MAG: hypothetical protein VB025_14605 [Sphaerochaeta sp.]|nr:hypothetical protein [Sphaerochaeta sp.]